MAFEAYPPVAPDRLCQDWWHLSEEGKGALGPGNYISKGPEVRLYVDWLGWLIYSKSICWDLVMCWAQRRPTGHGPSSHGFMVQWAGEGGRKARGPAGVWMSTVEGFLIHSWGKERNQTTNNFPVAIITVIARTPYLSGFWLLQAVPSGSRPSWEQWVFPDWGF